MPFTISHVDFVGIATEDAQRAKQFYVEILGLPLERDTPTGVEVRAGQVTFGIWEPASMGMPFAPNANAIALHVDDVAEARAELEGKGVAFEGEVFDTGVCQMGFFRDPDGNALMLHHRYAPHS